VVIVIGGGAGTLSEIAIASQINKPIILIKNTGGWADQLNDDYLDSRKNARIYHIYYLQKLEALISKLLEDIAPKPGKINSGHNNETDYTR
jgi:predicted Rossmann-fold nucleotide-binding protein